MMLARIFPTALALTLACPLGIEPAHADIYTWIDKSGSINVSNLPPPDDVKVTNVMHEAPKPAPRDASGDSPSPDLQLLAERVRQLEQEVEFAKRQPPPMPYPIAQPPPMAYPVVPPPTVQYSSVQYQIIESPTPSGGYAGPANYGCDPGWDCGTWWGPGFYPPAVVVVGVPGFVRPFSPRGGPRFPMQKPGRVQGGIHRG